METKTQKPIIARLLESIKGYNPLRVYLFGSYARGESDELSDIDIVVIKETKLNFFDRFTEIVKFLNVPKSIDALVYTPDEFEKMREEGNAFVEMVLEEGILLYERP